MSVDFSFDGRPMTADPGQTVGGALLAAGVRSWRTTRFGGKPRGLFCGIGVCFDCLVTVNGEPNVRACLARVADGDVVVTQVGDGRG
jgi:predicted molibdopterin-dependent oxidoreductase YjgC